MLRPLGYIISFAAMICCLHSNPVAQAQAVSSTAVSLQPDTSMVPHDTISYRDHRLSFVNNLYLVDGKPFSGIIKAVYPDKRTRYYMPVWSGMQHGIYRSYYENGQSFEVRSYKNNLSSGRHYGYWENGHLKFDFTYANEKREGDFKQWYTDGKPYIFAHYTNDSEEGLQRGWRHNGKLFLNYVVKDGHTYGLQETMLCYTLRDQKIKSE